MNYLELCKRVRQEAGIPGLGPVTVQGQIGELKKVVDWVREAWLEVQLARDHWKFMLAEVELIWQQGYSERSAEQLNLLDLGRWGTDSQSVAPVGDPQRGTFLTVVPWSRFRSAYGARAAEVGAIRVITVLPNQSLRATTIADRDYMLTMSYYRAPQSLAADGDLPYLPTAYHDYIVYTALKKYAANDEAGNIYNDALAQIKLWKQIVERRELPEIIINSTPVGYASGSEWSGGNW